MFAASKTLKAFWQLWQTHAGVISTEIKLSNIFGLEDAGESEMNDDNNKWYFIKVVGKTWVWGLGPCQETLWHVAKNWGGLGIKPPQTTALQLSHCNTQRLIHLF